MNNIFRFTHWTIVTADQHVINKKNPTLILDLILHSYPLIKLAASPILFREVKYFTHYSHQCSVFKGLLFLRRANTVGKLPISSHVIVPYLSEIYKFMWLHLNEIITLQSNITCFEMWQQIIQAQQVYSIFKVIELYFKSRGILGLCRKMKNNKTDVGSGESHAAIVGARNTFYLTAIAIRNKQIIYRSSGFDWSPNVWTLYAIIVLTTLWHYLKFIWGQFSVTGHISRILILSCRPVW